MPALEGLHLGGAAGLAARLDDAGDRVVDPHEADRARGLAAAGELLAAGAEGREVGAGARAELEEHGLAVGQPHDPFHVVADALDEAGRGLGVLVGAGGPDDGAGLLVPPPVVGRPGDAVAVEEPDVEPDRRVERAVLVQAEGRQLVVEPLGVLGGGEVAVVAAPVGDRPGHPVDELADRVLPLALRGTAVAAGHVAVEVLADDDVGGELAPAAGNLAVGLLEDRPAALVLDLRRAEVPVDLVKRADPLGAEDPGNLHPRLASAPAPWSPPARSPPVPRRSPILPVRLPLPCAALQLRRHPGPILHHDPDPRCSRYLSKSPEMYFREVKIGIPLGRHDTWGTFFVADLGDDSNV